LAAQWAQLGLACLVACSCGPAGAQSETSPTFDVLEFEVEGNTTLPALDVEKALLPFLGEERTLEQVEAARTALEKAYQQAGLLTVLVDLPPQRVDGGVVRLVVTEGRVGALRVTGSRYHDQRRIRDIAGELAPGRVPDFDVVQQQMARLNRSPDRQVQPLLRPGVEPGTVDVELKVDDRLPLSGGAELNNRNSVGTKPLRFQGTLRYDNLFQSEQSIALTVVTAPQETQQTRVGVLNWSMPLDDQATLAAYVLASSSNVAPLGAATVVGQGITAGVRWIRPWFGDASSHSVTLGVDYKNIDERIGPGSADEISTPVEYAPFGATYAASWYGTERQTRLSQSFVFALRQVFENTVDCPGNVGPVDQFACKRQGGDGGFAYLRGDLRHERALLGGQLALRLGWQLSATPLVSSEQYALGGMESVRGYYEAEVSGDSAWQASIEWRSGNLLGAREGGDDVAATQLTANAFLDAGRAYLLQPAVGQSSSVQLVGTGFGLRVRGGRSLYGDLEVAWPLRALPARYTDGTSDTSPRVYARLGVAF
jgi:hemolysin activation/secretion protein